MSWCAAEKDKAVIDNNIQIFTGRVGIVARRMDSINYSSTMNTPSFSICSCPSPSFPQKRLLFQAPLLKNFTLVVEHIKHVARARREAMTPHIPLFMTSIFAHRRYQYHPVAQWRRYGLELRAEHGRLFMVALFNALREYLEDLRTTNPVLAHDLGLGLLELGMCWEETDADEPEFFLERLA